MQSATALEVGNKAGKAALLLANCTARVKAFLMVCRACQGVWGGVQGVPLPLSDRSDCASPLQGPQGVVAGVVRVLQGVAAGR